MFDCCVNLTHPSFAKDRIAVLERAMDFGLKGALLCSSDLESSLQTVALAEDLNRQLPLEVYVTVGVHPHQASGWQAKLKENFTLLVKQRQSRIRAIGETGLDYDRNYSPPQAQRQAFTAQLELAADLQLPVFLHQRASHRDFIDILSSFCNSLPAMLVHCFTGSAAELHSYLDLGCYIGITGWLCDDRRGKHLRPLIKSIPLNRLLVETDSPYLIPRSLPERKNNRNEPAYLCHIIEQIALYHSLNSKELSLLTYNNAKKFLNVSSESLENESYSH